MRCWRTTTGATLVEGAPYAPVIADYDFIAPGGQRLERAHSYYLLDAAFAVARTFEPGAGSDREHLYGHAHAVVGAELHELFCSWNTDHDAAPPFTSVSVELAGLEALSEAPAEDVVARAIAAHEARLRRGGGPA